MWDGLPDLSKNSLVDLAGWSMLRAGQDLRREGAVRRIEWNAPRLTGEVRLGGRDFRPTINLRSLAFAENRCSCGEGRRGYMCEHAIALCVEAERRREAGKGPDNAPGSAPAPKASAPPPARGNGSTPQSRPKALDRPREAQAEPDKGAEAPQPTWLRWEFANGRPLELQVHLPPNLAEAAPRDAIMVKLVAVDVKKPKPLEQLLRAEQYQLDAQTAVALGWLERWAHGRPASLLQLKREQLRTLLQALAGKPNVFYVNQPNRPLRWEGGKLPEIERHLGEPERAAPAKPAARGRPERKGPLSSDEREQIIARAAKSPQVPREGEGRRPKKDPVAERRRRLARLTGKSHVHSPALEQYRAREQAGQGAGQVLEIDGSEHFLSIRLPSKDDPRHYQLAEMLKGEGFRLEASNGRFWLRDRHKTLNFLARYWEELEREYDAVFTDNFRQRTEKLRPAKVAIDTKRDGRDYRVTLQLDAGGASDAQVYQALQGGLSYVESPSGEVRLLNPEQLNKVAQVQRKLTGQQERPLTPRVALSVSGAACLDVENILGELDGSMDLPQDWTERSAALKQVGALKPPPLPAEFQQRLRVYQQVGVAWLWHLYRHELGGILADEMGLGKTIQALGLVLCRWQAAKKGQDAEGPSVVVSPAGLTENWRREAQKFAPQLRVFLHHGNTRLQEPEEFGSFDLILTSYQTLVRDVELFTSAKLGLVIADEAQHIKNRRTLAATSLRALQAPGRMVLTGTPIENSVDDLRSIFSFILPGYLAQIPDGTKGEERNWYDQRHLQQAAPYILRRSKKLVAAELPEKIEQVVPCDLSQRQRDLYEKVRVKTEQAIFELEMSGAAEQKVRFAALTQLLRLRQACVDPRLVNDEARQGDSAKLAAFREILEECLDGGHRILVFSQFTQALKLLQQFLQKRDINHLYLDGSTKNRAALCERFNRDESIPVFLISLKAGGTGLNLTGADTVVHYDPWWNPAVEAQATDRAHRIGQTRVVTSYKLITTNTVEEKVLELQERKAGFLQDLLDESAASTAKVSLGDIKALLKE
ncbi:MAG: SNF2-like protein [Puniceicoccaceae bacterium 5H]|nr:MAG: SNF2-like protein [Puniceicoccaceae bacterium 5H]